MTWLQHQIFSWRFEAVVGSIVWAFCRPKYPRSREISASGYALHSVCPQLSIFATIQVTGYDFFGKRKRKIFVQDNKRGFIVKKRWSESFATFTDAIHDDTRQYAKDTRKKQTSPKSRRRGTWADRPNEFHDRFSRHIRIPFSTYLHTKTHVSFNSSLQRCETSSNIRDVIPSTAAIWKYTDIPFWDR